jgi:chemotaxis protein MotA
MLVILGIVTVFAAVLGGFLLERGNLFVLLQPAELVIVGGAALGILLVSNPAGVIRRMGHGVGTVFRPSLYTCDYYLVNLRMLYEVFAYAQRAGVAAIENDVENPESGAIFTNYPVFLKDRETRAFVCDSLRMLVVGVTTPSELDRLMDLDIEVQRKGRHEPAGALATMADALPGLGIVAAVLGVVVTMESIGGAPEVIGQKVAAALVGTFLGILLCYGVVGPLASQLESRGEAQTNFQQALRTGIVAFARGASPILAIEFARRSIPLEERPSFAETETSIRKEARIPPLRREGQREEAPVAAGPAA